MYQVGSWQWLVIHLVTAIGYMAFAMTLFATFRPKTPLPTLFFWFAFWAIAPPLWFNLEYFHVFQSLPVTPKSAEVFERFKYGQEVSEKFWAGMAAMLVVRMGHAAWIQNQGRKEPEPPSSYS